MARRAFSHKKVTGPDVEATITKIALIDGVDHDALERIIYNESRGNINVGWDSAHYTQGIAQVSAAVWEKYTNIPWNLASDPSYYEENINVAAEYLKSLYNRFGSWKIALAAYNEGPGNMVRILRGEKELSPITQSYISGFGD